MIYSNMTTELLTDFGAQSAASAASRTRIAEEMRSWPLGLGPGPGLGWILVLEAALAAD